jgi:hypothetical protein
LLRGLLSIDADVQVFAPIWDTLFPKGKLWPGDQKYLDATINQTLISYTNLPLCRTASVGMSVAKAIKKRLDTGERPLAVLTYNTYPHYVKAMEIVKHRFPEVPWVNVILDMDDPIQDDWQAFNVSTRHSDGCVFLSWWGFENAPFDKKLHLDGGCDEFVECDSAGSIEKKFVYAGKYVGYGGITDILNAIKSTENPNLRFEFFGKERCEALENLAAIDSRIRIRGFVEECELESACRNAHAFLAPREIAFQGTRMIFPSKILFFLKFGKPIISPLLPGMSPEYASLLISPSDSTATSWSSSINHVAQMKSCDLETIATRIRIFLNRRTWQSQSNRLLDFIKAL